MKYGRLLTLERCTPIGKVSNMRRQRTTQVSKCVALANQTKSLAWHSPRAIRALFICIVFGLSANNAWSALQARTTPHATPEDASLTGSTTIPIEVDGGMVIVPARINEQPYDFILDNGAMDIVTPAVAEQLGIHTQGKAGLTGVGGARLSAQFASIREVSIGDAKLRSQSFLVLPLPYEVVGRGKKAPLAGFIGSEWFEHFAVRVDYDRKLLVLTKLADYKHEGVGVPIPLDFVAGHALMDVRINDLPGKAELDIGNNGFTVVLAHWAHRNGIAARLKAGIQTGARGVAGKVPEWASRIDSLEIGGSVLRQPIVVYSDSKTDGFAPPGMSSELAANLGTDALSNFVIETDYRHKVVWFDRQTSHRSRPYNRTGLDIERSGPDEFTIVDVQPHSPAEQVGLRPGERIVAIDGVPAIDWGHERLRERMIDAPGTELTVTVDDGGGKRDVRLALAELLP
jgi:hypothetical protein